MSLIAHFLMITVHDIIRKSYRSFFVNLEFVSENLEQHFVCLAYKFSDVFGGNVLLVINHFGN